MYDITIEVYFTGVIYRKAGKWVLFYAKFN